MKAFDEVLNEYFHRQEDRGVLLQFMRNARDHFNGDVVIPLPEMDEDERPGVANLMAQGLDQTAMRVASVLPSMEFPPMIPGKDKDKGSEDWARKRNMAVMGWWQESGINLSLRRLARWAVGYGTGPMIVRPNFKTGIPQYVLRDPLGAFPSTTDFLDDSQPENVIHAYSKSFAWVEARYPDAADEIERKLNHRPRGDAIVDLIEWMGPEERILGLAAVKPTGSGRMWTPRSSTHFARAVGVEILRVPNRTGMCWSVQSNRITIDRLQGQFDQIFGVYQNQAELMALENIAVKKAIFPDLVLQGNTPGRTPQLINGTWADGRSGEINIVRDGTVQPLQLNPGFMTQPLIDRHERTIRAAGVPAQFSGETPSNIATGRLGNQTLSATVDYPIQEYQEIIAATLQAANKRAIAIAKAYFGSTKKSFHVSFNKAKGQADYTPDTHFETDAHFVRYSAPGADVNSLVIGIGQRIGIGTMSKATAVKQDPMIPDPEFELRTVTSERIEEALLEYISVQVQQGAIDPLDVIGLAEAVQAGTSLGDAWKEAQEAAQKRQAEAAAEQQQAGMQQPGGPPDPSQQPGLSPGEAGGAIEGPTPNMENLSQMLGSLRQPRALTSSMSAGPGTATPPSQPVG